MFMFEKSQDERRFSMFNGAITKLQFLNLAGFELSLWRDNTSEFMHVSVLAKAVKG